MANKMSRVEMLDWLCENIRCWPIEGEIRLAPDKTMPAGWFIDNVNTVTQTVRSIHEMGVDIVYRKDYLATLASCQDKEQLAPDMVNAPPHYMLLPEQGVEVIDVREAILRKIPEGTDPVLVDCWSRSWEYLTRMWEKNGEEDARKAEWYLKRMLEGFDKSVPPMREHEPSEDQ